MGAPGVVWDGNAVGPEVNVRGLSVEAESLNVKCSLVQHEHVANNVVASFGERAQVHWLVSGSGGGSGSGCRSLLFHHHHLVVHHHHHVVFGCQRGQRGRLGLLVGELLVGGLRLLVGELLVGGLRGVGCRGVSWLGLVGLLVGVGLRLKERFGKMGGRGFLSKIDFGMFSFNEWYLDVTI
jgi:hypothetical protein